MRAVLSPLYARSPLVILVLACTAGLIWPAGAAGQETVTWDHAECDAGEDPTSAQCNPVRAVTAGDGELITLMIENTCPDAFDYLVVAVPLPAEGVPQAEVAACEESHPVPIHHDERYGGYVVHVVWNQEGATRPERGNARVTIAVTTSEWRVGFAGGFTFNGLTDPSYGLTDVSVTQADGSTLTQYRLDEETEKEDDLGQSVASFVHLSHSAKLSWLGLTFGLGVEPDHAGDYYLGGSLLLGDRAAITVGGMVGRLAAPPAGLQVGDTLSDANALANLGDRRALRPFVGISYRFLGNGPAELDKPFRGAEPAPGGRSAPADGAGGAVDEDDDPGEGDDDEDPEPETGPPTRIAVAGGGQSVVQGQAAPDPIKVTVFDSNDNPVDGATVTFEQAPGITFVGPDRTAGGGTATFSATAAADAEPGDRRIRVEACVAVGGCVPETFQLTVVAPEGGDGADAR